MAGSRNTHTILCLWILLYPEAARSVHSIVKKSAEETETGMKIDRIGPSLRTSVFEKKPELPRKTLDLSSRGVGGQLEQAKGHVSVPGGGLLCQGIAGNLSMWSQEFSLLYVQLETCLQNHQLLVYCGRKIDA